MKSIITHFHFSCWKFCPLIIAIALLSCDEHNLLITDMTCEYLSNPYAINTMNPALGWKIQSNERGKIQTAYQILAASSKQRLAKNIGDLWDTGIIPSDQSQHIIYSGKPLKSRDQVYWKVRVWDETNTESKWSETATWKIGITDQNEWKAKWISNRIDTFPKVAKTYPAPFFRKVFTTKKAIKQATLYICGLGFYEAHINENRIGKQVLAPAVTNYDTRPLTNLLYQYDDQSTQRVLYNAFDVTKTISKGENTIGIILGNGWYNQRDRTVEGDMWYNSPRLIAQLEIEYKDGERLMVLSDDTWRTNTGPYLHDGIFTGEIYDARKEFHNWLSTDFNDSIWAQAILVNSPTGKLEAQTAPFDEIVHQLNPLFEEKIDDSTSLFSLPYTVSGWVEINMNGNRGDQITLRFISEEDNDYGQQDIYILKGEPDERWEPKFTWHTFRRFKVISKGLSLTPQNFIVKAVNTNPHRAGSFYSSNELLNKINEFYTRTQEANFHGSISSDCPHRERLAYTGDGQVAVQAALYSYDMTQFYRKWFNDFEDARNKITGYVPHTAPFGGGGGGPAWGSAMVIMPWAYFCHYGDTATLRQHYQAMKHWVEYLGTRTDERGIVVREEPNGWCLGDWCTPGKVELPEPLVNTAYYFHVTKTMINVAHVIGKEEDAKQFESLAREIKRNFNKAFYSKDQTRYWEGRQGANIFPLAFGLVDEENINAVYKDLLNHLETIDYHFDTGILATPLLLLVLTQFGDADIAYKIMNQQTYPSFGYYMMNDRFSTMWEDWEGKQSMCHPMFGSVVAWFYNSLGGIKPDEQNPGMKHFIISPSFVEDLTQVRCSYQTLYGIIRSEWSKESPSTLTLNVEVPPNCSATVLIPGDNNDVLFEGGKVLENQKGIISFSHDGSTNEILIQSGSYSFELLRR